MVTLEERQIGIIELNNDLKQIKYATLLDNISKSRSVLYDFDLLVDPEQGPVYVLSIVSIQKHVF